ncbi:hypothetical protein CRG98_023046 [Punica granatum]|uniref:GDSL esterase/lipase 1-like n=1 Tax=Punica granatum TaxID=22663 RepID=A0A2I0JKQ4_PUNGR|nr:hypothetical protein CRG98_023046 [Punica granatum]
MVIGNVTSVISGIHSKGGRKFGVNSLGPLGCIPVVRALPGTNGACSNEFNELLKLHNGALAKALQNLGAELDGFKYSNFDFFIVVTELTDNPSKYGFKESKEACCGSGPYRGNSTCGRRIGEIEYKLCPNPSGHIFFDNNHPTKRANQLYAELMWSGSTNITGPYNLEELFKPGKYEFTGGANFATSGAGALAETYSGFVVDLKSQLRLFEKMEKQLKKNFGDELAAKTISEAVYLFSIGSGDYSSTFFTNSTLFQSHSHEEYVAMVIGNITSVISVSILKYTRSPVTAAPNGSA